MAQATGTITFNSLPDQYTKITLDDGQAGEYSDLVLAILTEGNSTPQYWYAGSSDSNNQVDGNAANFLPLYRESGGSLHTKPNLQINFKDQDGATFADWRDKWSSTGGSQPFKLRIRDHAGDTVDLDFYARDGETAFGVSDKLGSGTYTQLVRKNSSTSYSIMVPAHATHTYDYKFTGAVDAALDDIVSNGTLAITNDIQTTRWNRIISTQRGSAGIGLSVTVMRYGSASWTSLDAAICMITGHTSTSNGYDIAHLQHLNETAYAPFSEDIAGSSGSTMSTSAFATYVADAINAAGIAITAVASSDSVTLTNDAHGTSGNTTITAVNSGSGATNTSVSGMSGGSAASGGSTAMRTTISAKQLALSSSGGISAYTGSSDQPSLKMDISALAALGASPASGDFIPVHDITTAGSVKKITVAELIGSVAAGSDTQVQFNDGGSSLGGDAGLTYNKTSDTLSVGNDLKLTSDSAILSLGAGDDATLTHDGTTGLTIAASPISIDSTGELHLNSTTGDIKLQDGGVDQIAFDLDGTAGEVIMKPAVDSDDLVFAQYDGTEVIRIEDSGAVDFAGGAGSTGVTVSAAGAITVDGISTLGATTGVTVSAAGVLNVDNATDATSATDGSLQTDGGLSVVKDIIAGNDVKLLSDSAVLAMGAGSDITLTHDGSTGGTLASAGAFVVDGAAAVTVDSDAALTLGGASIDMDADGGAVAIDGTAGVNLGTATSGVAISIGHSTSEVTVNDNLTVTGDLTINGATTTVSTTNMVVEDKFIELGNGVSGSPSGDAGFVIERGSSDNAAVIWDESEDEFFLGTGAATGASTGNLSLTAADLQIAGLTATTVAGTQAATLASAAGVTTIGSSTAATFSAAGLLNVNNTTEATSATDGSLQTDGGLSVVKDIIAGNDVKLLSDSAVLAMGAGSDVTITHDGSTGATLASAGAFVIDGAAAVTMDSDAALTLGGASIDMDADGGAVAIDGTGGVSLGTATSGVAISIGHSTSEVTVNDNLNTTGRILVNDTTEATSATDGSLQTDGGLSVAKSVVIGDDLDLLSNSAIFKVGSDQPFTLTHANSSNTATVSSGHKLAFGDAGDYISGDGTDLLLVSSADVKVTGDLIPSADDTYDLGTTSAAWQDLHLEGDIKAQDAMEIDTAAGAITIDGAEGVDIQEGGTSVITIDTNRDVLFASTGGSSGDPDVEFDGYTRFDGTAEFDGSVDIDGAVSLDNASVTFSALADLTNSTVASGDKFIIQDAAGGASSGVASEITFDHVAEKMAGAGLANTSGVLSIAHHQDTFISGGGTAGNAGRIFTMTATPASADAVSVYVNGLLQARSGSYTANGFNGERDYNISGTTLTLVSSNALAAGDELVVRFIKT